MAKQRKTEPTDPLVRGTLVHQMLAQYYQQKKDPRYASPLEGLRHAVEVNNEENPSPLWEQHADKLQHIIPLYEAKWAVPERAWDIVGVETEYVVNVIDDQTGEKYVYSQRADLVIRYRKDDRFYIIDHKTAGYASPAVNSRYSLSGQFVGYNWLGRMAYGEQFGGVILNMIAFEPKKGPTFSRPKLEETPRAIAEFKQTILYAERQLASLRKTYGPEETHGHLWPAVLSDGPPCMGPYGPCPFRDYCKGVDR